jgi:antitoxin StbD
MTSRTLANTTASITELKKNPTQVLRKGEGQPVAILNRNQTVFYCVPADLYERLLDLAEDVELNAIADSRFSDGRQAVEVSLRNA